MRVSRLIGWLPTIAEMRRLGPFSGLIALAAVGLFAWVPADASPPVAKVGCAALTTAQQHNDALGADIDSLRSALQQVFVLGGQAQAINDASITVNRDLADLKTDAGRIGAKRLTETVDVLSGAVHDMNQSVNGLHGGPGESQSGFVIPTSDTYGFVDTASDKELAVAAVLNQLRAKGCVGNTTAAGT